MTLNVRIDAWGVSLVRVLKRCGGRAARSAGDIKLSHYGGMLVSSTRAGQLVGSVRPYREPRWLSAPAPEPLGSSVPAQGVALRSCDNPSTTSFGRVGAIIEDGGISLPPRKGVMPFACLGHRHCLLLLRGR